ncbi:MAG: MBL fold metallo-hydrolase [Alphaproteobacteria bacterium]
MLSIKFYQAGFCKHPECVISGRLGLRHFKKVATPMVCALIKHPKHGLILFDVGYSDNFFKATRSMPYRLYKIITPVEVEKTLAMLLHDDHINPKDIRYIFISHFHADHIAAIDDFPHAKIITAQVGYDYAKNISGLAAVKKAILPDLIKLFDKRRFLFIEDQVKIKGHKKLYDFMTYDIFGDGSLVAVSLPGHARGQYGLYMQDSKLGKVFLLADATWLLPSLIDNRLPLPIVASLSDNYRQYVKTFHALHRFYHDNREVKMVPCHCQKTFDKMSMILNK